MGRLILDTDTVIAILRRQPGLLARLLAATTEAGCVLMCPVVHFEVLRGLTRREARGQLSFYQLIVGDMKYEEMVQADWDLAAQLWADSVRTGRPADDADTLIAAFAINRDATLVTHNARHFEHLPVSAESWLEPLPPA